MHKAELKSCGTYEVHPGFDAENGHKFGPSACSIISRQRSDTGDESLATSAQQSAELPDYTIIFLVLTRMIAAVRHYFR